MIRTPRAPAAFRVAIVRPPAARLEGGSLRVVFCTSFGEQIEQFWMNLLWRQNVGTGTSVERELKAAPLALTPGKFGGARRHRTTALADVAVSATT